MKSESSKICWKVAFFEREILLHILQLRAEKVETCVGEYLIFTHISGALGLKFKILCSHLFILF